MNWTQRHLRMFLTTARLGHITRASQALHISQPALTRSIAAFEAQLGVLLFERSTRRLALTHEGQLLLPMAQRLLDDMERAQDAVRGSDRAGGLGGLVSIAVGAAFGSTVLPAAVSALQQAHSGIRLRIVDANSGDITAQVQRSEVDLGIGTPVGDTAALRCTHLLSAPIGLLGPVQRWWLDRDSVPYADLGRLPLLKQPADTSIARTLSLHGSDVVGHMAQGIEVSHLALQVSLAQAGLGVAVVSALGASCPMAQGLHFAPLNPAVEREVFLMQRKDQPPSPAARALIRAIQTALPTVALHPSVRRFAQSA